MKDMDCSSNNAVDMKEWISYMKTDNKCGFNNDEDKYVDVWYSVDQDNSGSLSMVEFAELIRWYLAEWAKN